MTLLAVRQQFIVLGGRHDLASADGETAWGTDNGADWFINAGVRFLDLVQEHKKSAAQHDETLSIGEWKINLENCRVVKEVWAKDSDGARTKLDYKPQADMREDYPELDGEDNGTSIYWCPYVSRYAPADVASGENIKYHSVMVMPPTDEEITAEVLGVFHALPLTSNTQENFWTYHYPDLLVMAALRSLESFYRNTQGVKDYEASMEPLLRGLDLDSADEMTVEDMEMQG